MKIGVIPAAGAGIRMYPSARFMPKVMLEIDNKPIIQRNVEIMRDKLGIKEIFIIVGYLKDEIKSRLKDGSEFGVKITYIDCQNVEAGLAKGLYLVKDYIKEQFVVILGDEFYLDSNHDEIKDLLDKDYSAICGITHTDNTNLIKKNYSVNVENGVIAKLVEKPRALHNDLLGCGTYVFKPSVFDYIMKTPVCLRSRRVELTDVVGLMAKETKKVLPFYLKGEYENINSIDDLNRANHMARQRGFKDYKISIIIPAYNEEESIGHAVKDFIDKAYEVIVVNNCSKDKTEEIAKGLGARVITRQLKGYGEALKLGMDEAKGDILVLVEADATFKSKDLPKMLEYLKDADMVIGTRTTKQMIEQAANMDRLLRWGNVTFGKIIELLWISQEPRLTDVGCTYRAIWRGAYEKIKDKLKGTGPEFSPEMMIEVIRSKQRLIEIPISYHARFGGASKISSTKLKAAHTAFRMLKLILKKRLGL